MCHAESSNPTNPAAGGGGAPGACATAPCPAAKKRKVVKITAHVPTTQSARGSHAIAPPKAYDEFTSASNDKALASNAPTVLLRNSKAIDLVAETDPPNQADVAWAVVPNPGPAAGPALTPSGIKAKLGTDAAGGFAISASLDGTTVYWNLVLVEVTVTSSAIQRNSGNLKDSGGGGSVGVGTGDFNVGNPAVCAMYAKANVTLSAGGQASLDTYCDKVTVGMPQNLLNDSASCQYDGGGQERERINETSGLASPVVDPAVKVTDLGYPILDRGGDSATRATGGDTIFLSSTKSTPGTGTNRVVETCDSPAVGFDGLHPEFGKAATKRATGISGKNEFLLYLVAYSDDANYTYVAYGSAPWTADYSGSVDAAGKWTKGASAGITGAGAEFTTIPHGKEAQDAGCEVRPPVFLDYIIDAR